MARKLSSVQTQKHFGNKSLDQFIDVGGNFLIKIDFENWQNIIFIHSYLKMKLENNYDRLSYADVHFGMVFVWTKPGLS